MLRHPADYSGQTNRAGGIDLSKQHGKIAAVRNFSKVNYLNFKSEHMTRGQI